jgi:hypothetical protein
MHGYYECGVNDGRVEKSEAIVRKWSCLYRHSDVRMYICDVISGWRESDRRRRERELLPNICFRHPSCQIRKNNPYS